MKKLRIAARASVIVSPIIFSAVLWGQSSKTNGTIAGRVQDQKSKEALPGVNVLIEGTNIGAATDFDGRFVIRAVPVGTYRVRASIIGYLPETTANVVIASGDTVRLSFALRETAIDMPEVVTAGRKPQSFMETPSKVSVVSARQIEQQNFVTIDDVLQFTSGVNMMAGQVNIRGSSGYSRGAGTRVLILVDGVPMLPGDSGDIKWDAIPPNEIDHIEIVKGASSALYGSNALGGVINIISKEPSDKPVTTLKATVGIYDDPVYPEWKFTDRTLNFNHQDLTHSRTVGKLKFRASIGRRESTGYAENGHYHRFNFSSKGKYTLTPTTFLSGYFNYADDIHGEYIQWKSLNEATKVPEGDSDKQTDSFRIQTGGSYQTILTEKSKLNAKYSFFRNGFENDLAETDPNRFFQTTSSRVVSKANNHNLDLQYDYEFNPVNSSTVGVTASVNQVNSDIFGTHDSYLVSGFVQHVWRPSVPLTLQGSLRFDHFSVDTGLKEYHLNPRLGVNYQVGPGTTLHASTGRGFRAPSMAEMFILTKSGGFIILPNPNLISELGWSHEVGADVAFSRFFLSTALFWSDFNNMIEGDLVQKQSERVIQFLNFNRAQIRGAEIEVNGAIWKRRLNFNLSYTFLDPRELERRDNETGEIVPTDTTLAYRARHLVSGSGTLNLGRYSFGADYRFVSRILDVRVYPDQPRVSQQVTNLRVGGRFDPVEITFNAYNIFNYNYTQVESRLEPIRSFALSTTLIF